MNKSPTGLNSILEVSDLNPGSDPMSAEIMKNEEVQIKSKLDYFGILGSALCMVHCLALPSLVPYVNLFMNDSSQASHDLFHFIIFPALLFMALTSINKGFRFHRKRLPVYLASFGLSCLVFNIIVEVLHFHDFPYLTHLNILGSSLLILAHSLNLTFSLNLKNTEKCAHFSCRCHK